MNYIQDNMFLDQLPERLIIGCVDSNALNGTITKNPFDFKHYKINFVALNTFLTNKARSLILIL
jgi:hypothetical protein